MANARRFKWWGTSPDAPKMATLKLS